MKQKILISVLISLSFFIVAYSQDSTNCVKDGPSANCKESKISLPQMASAVTEPADTSPVPSPIGTDRLFVKSNDFSTVLDVWTCRARSPIIVNIPINRVITKIDKTTNPTGYQAFLNHHQGGAMLSNLKIRVPAYDIDATDPIPEVDKVYFNGYYIGNLRGKPDEWELNEFNVPISKVNFGKYQGIGNPSLPGNNELKIEIDTLNNGWCTTIDWISLGFETMSPMVLIHGNGSDGDFYERRGFTETLDNQKMLYDNDLNMPKPGNYIEDARGELGEAVGGIPNNKRVQDHLRLVASAFGVNSLHLIMHSKGGLDTRSYLANLYSQDRTQFRILSYTSLSTPHEGSVLANVAKTYYEALKTSQDVEFPDFPTFTNTLNALNKFSRGQENLTTDYLAKFNEFNIPRLRESGSEIDFYTIAADADINFNGYLDFAYTPCEHEGLAEEQLGQIFELCMPLPGVDGMYQTLKKTQKVQVTYRTEMRAVPGYPQLLPFRVAVITGTPLPSNYTRPNDTLVTVQSGHGDYSMYPLVNANTTTTPSRKTYSFSEGKNHASIANGTVAVQVLGWVFATEIKKGDLKTLPN